MNKRKGGALCFSGWSRFARNDKYCEWQAERNGKVGLSQP